MWFGQMAFAKRSLQQLTHLRSVVTKSLEEFGKPPLATRKLGLNVYS